MPRGLTGPAAAVEAGTGLTKALARNGTAARQSLPARGADGVD